MKTNARDVGILTFRVLGLSLKHTPPRKAKIMTSTATARKPSKAERKIANQQKAAEARKALTAQTKAADSFELDEDDDKTMRVFVSLTEHYSENNAMLILGQAAALGLKVRGLKDVGGFNAFKERGRKIKDDQRNNRLIGVWARVTHEAAEGDEVRVVVENGRKIKVSFRVMGIYHSSQTEPADVPTGDAAVHAERAAAVDVDRKSGETRDQAVKRAYGEWTAEQYRAAEDATRGHLLNPAAREAGKEARDLFTGRADVARKYASPELIQWWDANPRMTLTQYREQMHA
jgi:hypothetical protein